MQDENLIVGLTNLIEKNQTAKNPILDVIINNLPFGISVQDKKRLIIFENDKAKELVGPFQSQHCYLRWDHIPGEGKTICKDCPATMSLIDGTSHKIFRKTLNRNNGDLFIEIQVIPIIERDKSINTYIEIINDVSDDQKVKSLINIPIAEIVDNLQFSISSYGDTGGEIIIKDELPFFENSQAYIQKLSLFTYIGVFQNNFDREGLFGPLPVLDLPNKSMMVYSFRLHSHTITDPRRNGQEPCLLLIYFNRDNYIIFEHRLEILDFLNKRFFNKKLEEINEIWFDLFKSEFKGLLIKLLNKFELKK